MTKLTIDFETRSCVDLKKEGLDRYAKHGSTDAWCMAYAFDDGPVELWRRGEPLPREVRAHVAAGGVVEAHNAGFEWHVWNTVMVPRYGWPPLAIEQCRCTAAMAAAMSLPRDLETLAVALQLDVQKDMAGNRLMKKMMRPRNARAVKDEGAAPIWWDSEADQARLGEYCKTDVETERAAAKRMLALRESEQALWLLDHRINQRGITIDTKLVEKALMVVDEATARADAEMARLTGGAVTACSQATRLVDWLRSRGVETKSIDREHLHDLLELPDLADDVERALRLRQETAKTSTAKLEKMLTAVSPDGRLRGMFLFHGAGTGRWTGRLVQLHNMTRSKVKPGQVDQVLEIVGAINS